MWKNIIYLVCLLFIMPLAAEAEELIINGFQLPARLDNDRQVDADSIKYTKYPRSFDLKYFLSAEGQIDSLIIETEDKEKYLEPIMAFLQSVEFSPGKYLDKNIPVILPAQIEFAYVRYKSRALLKLPHDSKTNISNDELVFKVLKENEFHPALLTTVPSYFFAHNQDRGVREYHYAVFQVELDSAGIVKHVETMYSSYNHLSDMFSTILLYSEFQPAKYKSEAIESNVFITVRFFKKLAYTSEEWPGIIEGEELDYSFEYHRISYKPYLDSIANPPMPSNLTGGGIILEENILFDDTIQVDVTINADGNVRNRKYRSSYFRQSDSIVKSALKKLKYLPARDICGERVNYNGQLTLILSHNSNNIRIITNWLRE